MSFIKKIIRLIFSRFIEFQLNFFNKPIKIKDKKYLFKFDNLKIAVKTSDELTFRRWKAFQEHGKEIDTLNWINSFKETKKFYDIGANIGIFSIYAKLKKKMKVYSFEPEPNSFIQLFNTIALNNLDIIPLNIALDKKKELKFFNMIQFVGGISDSHLSDKIEKKINFLVSTDKLDSVISQNKIDFPNYIKIDVDGNELSILEGMQQTLENRELESMLIEIAKNNEIDILNYLKNFDFKLQSKSDNGNYIFKR